MVLSTCMCTKFYALTRSLRGGPPPSPLSTHPFPFSLFPFTGYQGGRRDFGGGYQRGSRPDDEDGGGDDGGGSGGGGNPYGGGGGQRDMDMQRRMQQQGGGGRSGGFLLYHVFSSFFFSFSLPFSPIVFLFKKQSG